MSTNQSDLLYFCDFPPSNFAGGPILLKRLLDDYPSDRLTVLTGSHYLKSAPPEDRLNCSHIVFPTSNETGRLGIGRIKSLISWLLIPFLTLLGIWLIKRRNLKTVLTVADGHFFIAAAFASLITFTPFILIVHDDWVATQKKRSYVIRFFCAPLFKFTARNASHIYAVSPGMQKLLKTEFGTESELQLPSTEIHKPHFLRQAEEAQPNPFRILYAGIGSGAVEEGLSLLVQTIKSGELSKLGLANCELHFYIPASEEDVKRLGWEHEAIKVHGWVSQQELRRALAAADLLFLPYSFSEEQKFFTTRSFPSKAADYLASGKPMLILSPGYASIVEYAAQYGFAEIVDKPSVEALAKSIFQVWSKPDYRETLSRNATKAFNLNHNIHSQRIVFRQLVNQLANGNPTENSTDAVASNL